MYRHMQLASTLAVVLLATTATRAQDSDDIANLKNKVKSLEQKVAGLEAQVASLQPLFQEYEQREAFRKETAELGATPGPIESTNRPVVANTALKTGQILQVEQDGAWWAGRILALLPDSSVKVHYVGWEPAWDEVVPRTRLQLDPDAVIKVKKSVARLLPPTIQSPPGPITPSDIQVTATTALKVGDTVHVEWGSAWWAGEVLSMMPDKMVKIRYVGWDAQWDEVVPRSRLRLPANRR